MSANTARKVLNDSPQPFRPMMQYVLQRHLRSVSPPRPQPTPRDTNLDVFDLIASLPAGDCTKEEIDARLHEERASWGEP